MLRADFTISLGNGRGGRGVEYSDHRVIPKDDGDSSPNALKAHREHTEFGSSFPSFPEWVRRLYCKSALEQGSLWLWTVFIKQNHTVFQRSGFPKTHSHSGQQPHLSLLRCKHATLWVLPIQEFGVQGNIFSSGNIMLVTCPLLCTYYIQHTHTEFALRQPLITMMWREHFNASSINIQLF